MTSLFWKRALTGALVAATGCFASVDDEPAVQTAALVAGAGYTTFDAVQGGCLGSLNGINCNNYEAKEDVYASGGPVKAGLSDGEYYFVVMTPGSQNGGFIEGAEGNLSDTVAGSTAGDDGSGDGIGNRTFQVTDHAIVSYAGTHVMGTSPNGKLIVQLMPYDDTDNPGGVYILGLCQVGATSPSQCKYDAFRIREGEVITEFPSVQGVKYYDRNANGMRDADEVGIAGWPIDFANGMTGTLITDESGEFIVELVADTYRFAEQVANAPWMQTGNRVDQSATAGDAEVSLMPDMSYEVRVADDSVVEGLYFGNLCLGAGGGHTLGFWSNKNGQALIGSDDLALLVGLNLRTATGAAFDPASKSALKSWLLSATATNMAYMLSAQLAAMELNVHNGFVSADALVYAPGAGSGNDAGFTTVGALMEEANASLGSHGYTPAGSTERAYQEALKNALDAANNDRSFVRPGPEACPAPSFP